MEARAGKGQARVTSRGEGRRVASFDLPAAGVTGVGPRAPRRRLPRPPPPRRSNASPRVGESPVARYTSPRVQEGFDRRCIRAGAIASGHLDADYNITRVFLILLVESVECGALISIELNTYLSLYTNPRWKQRDSTRSILGNCSVGSLLPRGQPCFH